VSARDSSVRDRDSDRDRAGKRERERENERQRERDGGENYSDSGERVCTETERDSRVG